MLYYIIITSYTYSYCIATGNGVLTTMRRTKYIQSQKEWASCT